MLDPSPRFASRSTIIPFTLIEADGTLLEPTQVSGVTMAVAQRCSVLLHANQTNVQNGTFWLRATLQNDMFTHYRGARTWTSEAVLLPSYGRGAGTDQRPSSLGTQTVPRVRTRETLAILL
jgi:FtsP/CotA-like multicopper oxidase with cupredoxin domain